MLNGLGRVGKDALNFWHACGTKAFIWRVIDELLRRVRTRKAGGTQTVSELLSQRFRTVQPISTVTVEREQYRLNLVTDSTGRESLFGGVATSLILATLFCRTYGLSLRIITRERPNNPRDYEAFIEMIGLKRPAKVEFYSDYDRGSRGARYKLETSEKDIFLSTSWWSAEAVRRINLRSAFFYILQEVEPFFYPHGDDRLLCERLLAAPDINYLINSKLLYDYYARDGHRQVAERGVYFEPAFPSRLYQPGENSFREKEKSTLFFYARPRNLRNLFFTGLGFLEKAFSLGILEKDEWDVVLAGSDTPRIAFSNGVVPRILGQLDWPDYLRFTRSVDLGFCLMYTPHPSYPPLDLAASGAVVLTNTYDNKQTLDRYSKNIICADLDDESMMKGFETTVRLCKDTGQRKANFLSNGIGRDWSENLRPVIEFMHKNK